MSFFACGTKKKKKKYEKPEVTPQQHCHTCDDTKRNLDAVLKENDNLLRENKCLQRHLQDLGQENNRLKRDGGLTRNHWGKQDYVALERDYWELKQKYEQEKREKENALNRNRHPHREQKQLHEERNVLQQKYENERKEKEDALMRLSSIASSKLRDNNPNITDLSDQNRPTKIAEKFSELYDNEWTDAFNAMEKFGISDEVIIETLLNILEKVHEECKMLGCDNVYQKVQRCIEYPGYVDPTKQIEVVLTDQIKQQIKEFRKLRAPTVIPDISKAVCEKIAFKYANDQAVRRYIDRCVEVCWLSAVQDPPLTLTTAMNAKFDREIFKDYTQRGPYVEYVVWPALHLYAGGPLLSKGVAQGSKTPVSSQNDFHQPVVEPTCPKSNQTPVVKSTMWLDSQDPMSSRSVLPQEVPNDQPAPPPVGPKPRLNMPSEPTQPKTDQPDIVLQSISPPRSSVQTARHDQNMQSWTGPRGALPVRETLPNQAIEQGRYDVRNHQVSNRDMTHQHLIPTGYKKRGQRSDTRYPNVTHSTTQHGTWNSHPNRYKHVNMMSNTDGRKVNSYPSHYKDHQRQMGATSYNENMQRHPQVSEKVQDLNINYQGYQETQNYSNEILTTDDRYASTKLDLDYHNNDISNYPQKESGQSRDIRAPPYQNNPRNPKTNLTRASCEKYSGNSSQRNRPQRNDASNYANVCLDWQVHEQTKYTKPHGQLRRETFI